MGPVGDLSIEATMSALGQQRTRRLEIAMSALPPKADMMGPLISQLEIRATVSPRIIRATGSQNAKIVDRASRGGIAGLL